MKRGTMILIVVIAALLIAFDTAFFRHVSSAAFAPFSIG